LPPADSRQTRISAEKVRAATSRGLVALVFLLTLPSVARTQDVSTSELRPVEPYKISVNVSSVVLHATVQNHKGAPVSGLGKDDFQIFEDGVLQPIEFYSHEDIPVTVGLVLDNSGSMGPKRAEVITAAMAFARSSNPQDQMFVVNFNEFVSLGLPANMPFTDQTAQLQAALARFNANGETALYDALALALEHLKKGNRDKKVLIVVSDGGDNASKHKLSQILAMAGQSDAIIYTIGIYTDEDPDQKPDALRQLAKATGGEAFFPQTIPDVVPICERIAHDIREQYTLAYSPAKIKPDGAYRAVVVKATAPGRGGLTVRTRTGYYTPSQAPLLPPVTASPSNRP
jgi:Ca-activated chloride channel homolog